ncbi:hypothetical protein ABIB80_004480 [Bradyrhizobium sp. i1.15.2]
MASPLSSAQQAMDQVFNWVTCHQNRIGRSLPVGNLTPALFLSPKGERSSAHSFLEGALTKAGLVSAKR